MNKSLFILCILSMNFFSVHAEEIDCKQLESSIWKVIHDIENSLSEREQATILIKDLNDSYSNLLENCRDDFLPSLSSLIYSTNIKYLSLYRNIESLLALLEQTDISNYNKTYSKEYYYGRYVFLLFVMQDERFSGAYRIFKDSHAVHECMGYCEKNLVFLDLIVNTEKSDYEKLHSLCLNNCNSEFLYHVSIMEYYKKNGFHSLLKSYSSDLVNKIFSSGVDIENLHSLIYALSYLSLVTEDEKKLIGINGYINYFSKDTEVGVVSAWVKGKNK